MNEDVPTGADQSGSMRLNVFTKRQRKGGGPEELAPFGVSLSVQTDSAGNISTCKAYGDGSGTGGGGNGLDPDELPCILPAYTVRGAMTYGIYNYTTTGAKMFLHGTTISNYEKKVYTAPRECTAGYGHWHLLTYSCSNTVLTITSNIKAERYNLPRRGNVTSCR